MTDLALDIIRVTDDTTKAEIAEALAHLRESQRRAPGCMAERYHQRYDALLQAWETAPT